MRTASFIEWYLHGVWYSVYDQCEDWYTHAGGMWHAIHLWALLGRSLLSTASRDTTWVSRDLSYSTFTSTLAAWPFLLPRVLLPRQFPEGVQHSLEVSKRWRIHHLPSSLLSLIIALDQNCDQIYMALVSSCQFLLCLWALDFSPC